GGYDKKSGASSTPGIQTNFNNEPGYKSTQISCQFGNLPAGVQGPIPIETFKKLNEAYQILQTALKQGLPTLNQNNSTVDVTYSYTCSGEGNNNCSQQVTGVDKQNGGTKITTQTIDGKTVNTTISSKVVDSTASGNTLHVSYTEITNELKGVPDSAQALLAQASTLINTINSACPWFTAPHQVNNGVQWKWDPNSGGGGMC
ncbi:SabA family sialic acid-binding adhesin, partial [Helicobacter pylori]|uniref:SabA family sialic acid-binding adhesin n=1 Tax=Helicobacter pylori TaxID=210 RepID=UPI00053535BC